MSTVHPYFEVDVFATSPFSGNPLAVIAEADGLSTAQMQAIASWTNFSETTFILSPTTPDADYRVRIFTPHEEFPFAGHPTLGTARVVAQLRGHQGDLGQECGLGLITVRQNDGILSFATPQLQKSGPLSQEELEETCAALGICPAAALDSGWIDNGPGWRLVQLADDTAVRSLTPSYTADIKVGVVGLRSPHSELSPEYAYEVRAFTRDFEDPVTGSLNGGTAQFLRQRGVVPAHYLAAQGSQVGRAGRVHISDDGTDVWIGGRVDIRVTGHISSGASPEDL